MRLKLALSLGCAGLLAHAEPIVFTHMADASACEWLGDGFVVVANDEDNLLRVYRLPQGGAPVASWDVSPFMDLAKKSPEMDIEGSAKIGDTIYWITSHAPNKNGKPRPNRKRFFATRVTVDNGAPSFSMAGKPVTDLLKHLARAPEYASLNLAAAAKLPPKTLESLNIEALCDTPDNRILIGFRSPVPQGKALLAPLLNPTEAVNGQAPRFGAPVLLDLGGNGVRAMFRHGDTYLIFSGSPLSGGEPRLYTWDGRAAPTRLLCPLPSDATPEAMTLVELDGAPSLLVLSDDGTRPVDGKPAKEHPDPLRRTFRGFLRNDIIKATSK